MNFVSPAAEFRKEDKIRGDDASDARQPHDPAMNMSAETKVRSPCCARIKMSRVVRHNHMKPVRVRIAQPLRDILAGDTMLPAALEFLPPCLKTPQIYAAVRAECRIFPLRLLQTGMIVSADPDAQVFKKPAVFLPADFLSFLRIGDLPLMIAETEIDRKFSGQRPKQHCGATVPFLSSRIRLARGDKISPGNSQLRMCIPDRAKNSGIISAVNFPMEIGQKNKRMTAADLVRQDCVFSCDKSGSVVNHRREQQQK